MEEDARHTNWNGTGSGSSNFISSWRSDLTSLSEQKAALAIDYDFQVNQKTNNKVTLGINDGAACEASRVLPMS